MNDDIHFYEPASGHGLPHDPFNAIVGPRPIGWISSQDAQGHLNLAPYSFFNAFNYTPPIIGFSSIGAKDSLRNIEQTREFGWNLATRALAELAVQAAKREALLRAFEASGKTETEFADMYGLNLAEVTAALARVRAAQAAKTAVTP